MKLESEIQQLIQIDGPMFGCILMRNNSGAFYDEKSQRLVRFGLGNTSKERIKEITSSDLIGFTRVVITQEMVGQTLAVFTAVETKDELWVRSLKDVHENAQSKFIEWIKASGGYAGFANSIKSFRKILGR